MNISIDCISIYVNFIDYASLARDLTDMTSNLFSSYFCLSHKVQHINIQHVVMYFQIILNYKKICYHKKSTK